MSSPENDPIGTVRVHPNDDPMEASARRRIKVESSDYSGPYEGCCWERFTTTFREGSPFGQDGTDPVTAEYVATWPVQPWWQLAAALSLPAGQEDAQTLRERREALREEWEDYFADQMGDSYLSRNEVVQLKERFVSWIIERTLQLERERDQAIAHDRQPYPTAWAYERLSEVHSELVEGLKRQLEPLVGEEAFTDHPGHQGLLEILGKVLTEAKLGHQMSEMLLERNYERGPQGLADFFSQVEAERVRWLDRERALLTAPSQPWTIQVPDELEEAMRTGIRAWLDVEPIVTGNFTLAGCDAIARGAAGAAYAVLEAADLVLAPRLRSGPLIRFAVGVPPDTYISDLYARFRAAGFELRLSAEKDED